VVPAFFVGEPVAVVNAVKCNVLYKGLENPVEISVPGANGDVNATCQGCEQMNKVKSGSYMIKPDKNQKVATISVSAMINGEQKSMGSKEFRIKRVPDPFAMFAGKKSSDSKISKGSIAGGDKVFAQMDPEFIFDGINYQIKKFTLTVLSGGKPYEESSNGNLLTSSMKSALAAVKAGNQVVVSNIVAIGPDGGERLLGNIALKVE
jgi:gliding motility-associated protein GldM